MVNDKAFNHINKIVIGALLMFTKNVGPYQKEL